MKNRTHLESFKKFKETFGNNITEAFNDLKLGSYTGLNLEEYIERCYQTGSKVLNQKSK